MKDLIVLEEEEGEGPLVLPPDPPGLAESIGFPVYECLGVGIVTRAGSCAFDNLPPGVYGLVCNCPRCSPRVFSS